MRKPVRRALHLLLGLTLVVACSPVSPDFTVSGRIAFIGGGASRNFQPYIGPAEGGTPIRLVTDAADYTGLSWSPDGRRLAFASSRAGNAVYNIYVMDDDGSDIRQIYGTEFSEFAPAWSPDGTRIAFQKQGTADSGWDLYLVNVDGTGLAVLTATNDDEELPAWSPDGTMLAYEAGSGSRDIFIIDADGTSRRQLTRGGNTVFGAPVWSPDGRTLAVHSTVHRGDQPRAAWGQFEIYLVDVATGAFSRRTFLADESHAARFPTWSPDGLSIAFELQAAIESQTAILYRIYAMQATGAQLKELNYGIGARFPRWSPQ